jgi:cellulose synthase (UDP-forming)
MEKYYFTQFEGRKPYIPQKTTFQLNLLFQFTALCTISFGCVYIFSRWNQSLSVDSNWLTYPLIIAESLAIIGTFLMLFTLWENKQTKKTLPAKYLDEINEDTKSNNQPVCVDIFITTVNESAFLLEKSIQDCKKIIYPFKYFELKIFLLDDGQRDGRDNQKENIKDLCRVHEINYITRETNEGFKAGNLKNGIEKSHGDFFLILDADTRVFPSILINTLGYFRNKNLAWVQTPQWFYDLNEGISLYNWLNSKKFLPKPIKTWIPYFLNNTFINRDLLGNDSQPFYDLILRRRNFHNAAFCCGAGSIHRRKAVIDCAVEVYFQEIKKKLKNRKNNNLKKLIVETELSPFRFHASEDLYTSLLMHNSSKNKWESIQHNEVECRMLSPQDLTTKIKQFQRYAEGTMNIAIHNNPMLMKNLSLSQKLCYLSTIWSYISCVWIIILITSPIVYFFSLQSPIQSFTTSMMIYFICFQISNTITNSIASNGINMQRSEQYYLSGFWYMINSLIRIAKGKKVKFHVTPKTKYRNNNIKPILPHITILTIGFIGIIRNLLLIRNETHPDKIAFTINFVWFMFIAWAFSPMIRSGFQK